MNDTVSEFKLISDDIAAHVDVLIKHSENYYVICREVPKFDGKLGCKAIYLTKQAIGSEIVSRLYRLIKNDPDAWNFPLLIERLQDDTFLPQLLPSFNHDGRKSLLELKALRDEVTALFAAVQDSSNFKRLSVYRARFVAHRVPYPRDLKKFGSEADVIDLTSAELRWLTDLLSIILDKVYYMIDRSGFAADDITYEAQDETCALWGVQPPKIRLSLKDVRNEILK
jgi:hypothetical protein